MMTTLIGLVAVIALIAANAWFVAAEFGYVAVRRHRIEEDADAGNAASQRALTVLSRLGFMLSGAQFGITVTSLIVGFISEPVFERLLAPLFGSLGIDGSLKTALTTATGFVVAVGGQMVLGELAPKNYAISKPEPVARSQARGLLVYMRVFGPIVRLFDSSANRLLGVFGLHAVEELDETVSVDELGYIVESAAEKGGLSEGQARLLGRVLSFRRLDADQVMVPRVKVHTVPDTARGAELLATARNAHTRFPVVHRTEAGIDEVRGVVTLKQLLAIEADRRDSIPITELMNPKPVEVVEATPAIEVLNTFRSTGLEMAVVIDEYGDLAGIVTLEDIVERLLGSIEDEYDPPVDGPQIGTADASGWRVRGGALLTDVRDRFDLDLPDGAYDTVGGLLMTELMDVPEVGDAVTVRQPGSRRRLQLLVEEMDGRSPSWVRISEQPTGDGAPDEDDGSSEAGEMAP